MRNKLLVAAIASLALGACQQSGDNRGERPGQRQGQSGSQSDMERKRPVVFDDQPGQGQTSRDREAAGQGGSNNTSNTGPVSRLEDGFQVSQSGSATQSGGTTKVLQGVQEVKEGVKEARSGDLHSAGQKVEQGAKDVQDGVKDMQSIGDKFRQEVQEIKKEISDFLNKEASEAQSQQDPNKAGAPGQNTTKPGTQPNDKPGTQEKH